MRLHFSLSRRALAASLLALAMPLAAHGQETPIKFQLDWRFEGPAAPYLVAINEATRLNLIVFVSACYGLDIATLFQPLEPAPARIVVGPTRSEARVRLDVSTLLLRRQTS